jgi:hypothetical protein
MQVQDWRMEKGTWQFLIFSSSTKASIIPSIPSLVSCSCSGEM